MENYWDFVVLSVAFGAYSVSILYYVIDKRYDFHVMFRGYEIMVQEFLIIWMHTQCCFFLIYYPDRRLHVIVSYIFLLTHYAFFVTYFLFVYRIILLNDIEFGKLSLDEYKTAKKRLKSWWNLKLTLILTFVLSIGPIIQYSLYSDGQSVLHMLDFSSSSTPSLWFTIIFFCVGFIEYLAYLLLFLKVIFDKHRLTIRIEVFLNLLIWSSYYCYRYMIPTSLSYGFSLPMRNISLTLILIISLHIRSKLTRIPDPPLIYETSMFLYEHKGLFDKFSLYLKERNDQNASAAFELGLLIAMFKLKGTSKSIDRINSLCKELQMKEFSFKRIEKIELSIREKNDEAYADFRKSSHFQDLLKAIKTHNINFLI